MPTSDLIRTVTINGSGGPASVEVLFGFSNVGVYRLFLWDAARQPTSLGFGDNVDKEPDLYPLPVAPADLASRQLSYEAQIESPKEGPSQMYSVIVLVRQDGKIVPGGTIERSGPLTGTNNKSVIGYVKFEVV